MLCLKYNALNKKNCVGVNPMPLYSHRLPKDISAKSAFKSVFCDLYAPLEILADRYRIVAPKKDKNLDSKFTDYRIISVYLLLFTCSFSRFCGCIIVPGKDFPTIKKGFLIFCF